MFRSHLSRRAFLGWCAAGVAAVAGAAAGCRRQPAATPTPSPAPEKPKLVYAYPEGREWQALTAQIGTATQEGPLAGVEVVARPISGDYYTLLVQESAGGTPPDVHVQPDELIPEWARQGVLMPLDAFLAADTGFSLDDFYAQNLDYVRFRGQLWALPWVCTPAVLLYNQELFASAKAEPAPGWSWEDCRLAAMALTDEAQGRWGLGRPEWWWQLAERIWQNGGETFSAERDRCLIGEPPAVEALEYWADLLLNAGLMPPASESGRGNWALFGGGRIATYENTLYVVTAFKETPLKIGLADVPAGRKNATLLMSGSQAIGAHTKRPYEAWTLLKLLTSPEALTAISTAMHVPCARISVNEKQPYADPALDVDWSVVMRGVESGHLPDVVPQAAEVGKLLQALTDDIFTGHKTVGEAIAEYVPKIDDLIAGGFEEATTS